MLIGFCGFGESCFFCVVDFFSEITFLSFLKNEIVEKRCHLNNAQKRTKVASLNIQGPKNCQPKGLRMVKSYKDKWKIMESYFRFRACGSFSRMKTSQQW